MANVGWGSVARDNVHVEGVELIRCVNGCITSLGTGPAYAMKCACVTEGEIGVAAYFQFKR